MRNGEVHSKNDLNSKNSLIEVVVNVIVREKAGGVCWRMSNENLFKKRF